MIVPGLNFLFSLLITLTQMRDMNELCSLRTWLIGLLFAKIYLASLLKPISKKEAALLYMYTDDLMVGHQDS